MKIKLVFNSPQKFGAITVDEMTVDADMLRLVLGDQPVLEVPVAAVRSIDWDDGRGTRARAEHPNAGRPWSAEEEAELRRLVAAGASRREMVARLGRSGGAIRSALLRLGLAERGGFTRAG